MNYASDYSHGTSQELSLAPLSELSTPDSIITYQTGTMMEPSIYTCHSPDMSMFTIPSIPSSESTHVDTDATVATSSADQSGATMNGIPSLPSHSTVGPSDGSEPPLSSPSEPPSVPSEPVVSSATIPSWDDDMGPHNHCDITGSLFGEIGSFRPVMKLKNAQWFLQRLMMKHDSASHRLLSVSNL